MTSCWPTTSLATSTTSRSMRFRSSRTLPCQGSWIRKSIARGESRLGLTSFSTLDRRRKCSASSGMSSRRARSGGTAMVRTLMRW